MLDDIIGIEVHPVNYNPTRFFSAKLRVFGNGKMNFRRINIREPENQEGGFVGERNPLWAVAGSRPQDCANSTREPAGM